MENFIITCKSCGSTNVGFGWHYSYVVQEVIAITCNNCNKKEIH